MALFSSTALLGLAAPASASAASSLRFLGCVTGKLPVGRMPRAPRPGGCTPTRTAVLDAEGSGLDHLQSIAASPDGRTLYAVSSREDTVSVFRAKPLGLRECFSANAKLRKRGRQPCKLLPHAGEEDALSGFNGVRFVTTSPDGRDVYTVSGDDSIGTFARNRHTGQLAYKGCITGAIGANSTGKHRVCAPIPTATPVIEGIDSGFGGPASLTVSPDNRFVYVAARGDAAVTTFARNPDGSLAFRGCLTGGISGFVVGFHSVCTPIADQAGNPNALVLRSISRIAISADGTSLYASAPKSSSLAEFQRDPASGQLGYRGCITAEIGMNAGVSAACTPIPTAVEAGFGSGMWLINRLALSRDGRSLYGAAPGDDAIDSFSRDLATGALVYQGCITGDSALAEDRNAANPCKPVPGAQPQGDGSGLGEPTDLAISPSGRSVYVAARKGPAIARLARDPATGAIAFSECLTNRAAVARPAGRCALAHGPGGVHQLGFAGLGSLAIAGGNLYASASGQSAISRFAIGR